MLGVVEVHVAMVVCEHTGDFRGRNAPSISATRTSERSA